MKQAKRRTYIGRVSDSLYSTDLLALAAQLRAERLTELDGTARRTARLCGSELEIDVQMDGERVADAAVRVRACALGQASAAVLMGAIQGATLEELRAARDAVFKMLKDRGAPPDGRFAEASALESVRDYPARHQSVMLAWDAAVEAVEGAVP